MARRRFKFGVIRPGKRLHGVLPALVLAFAYLAAQAVAITHDLGPEGHPAGEVCAICVTLGSLGTGEVTPPHAATPSAAHEAAASAGHVLRPAARAAAYRARAPPTAS